MDVVKVSLLAENEWQILTLSINTWAIMSRDGTCS